MFSDHVLCQFVYLVPSPFVFFFILWLFLFYLLNCYCWHFSCVLLFTLSRQSLNNLLITSPYLFTMISTSSQTGKPLNGCQYMYFVFIVYTLYNNNLDVFPIADESNSKPTDHLVLNCTKAQFFVINYSVLTMREKWFMKGLRNLWNSENGCIMCEDQL